jgi:hypothetical protein
MFAIVYSCIYFITKEIKTPSKGNNKKSTKGNKSKKFKKSIINKK